MNKTIATIAEELSAISTFSALPNEDLHAVAEICSEIHFLRGTILAHECLDATELFALLNGEVEIWIDYGNEDADLLLITKAPRLVGEMSIVDELPRSATIIARTDINGYSMEAHSFRQLLRKRGSIAISLMKGISQLVRTSNDSFVSELRLRNMELSKTNTYLKQAQDQLVFQERLSSLGKFVSMIMHDIRNPLSVIKTHADIMEFKLLNESNGKNFERYISQIRREITRLAGLTTEWLDYSRGEIQLAYSPTRIADIFDQLKENLGSVLDAKGIGLTWHNEFPDAILLDTERILRVMINLLNNALKACSQGGNITVSAVKKPNALCLSVKDDGIGMDKETQVHIFEPFYTKSGQGGTGLGMHIVKTVVNAHDGTVEVSSQPGEGAEVTIHIPLQP